MLQNDPSRRLNFLTLICLAVTMGLLALGTTSAGAAYPERPIKMIVPWAAGGDTDAICRVIAIACRKTLESPLSSSISPGHRGPSEPGRP